MSEDIETLTEEQMNWLVAFLEVMGEKPAKKSSRQGDSPVNVKGLESDVLKDFVQDQMWDIDQNLSSRIETGKFKHNEYLNNVQSPISIFKSKLDTYVTSGTLLTEIAELKSTMQTELLRYSTKKDTVDKEMDKKNDKISEKKGIFGAIKKVGVLISNKQDEGKQKPRQEKIVEIGKFISYLENTEKLATKIQDRRLQVVQSMTKGERNLFLAENPEIRTEVLRGAFANAPDPGNLWKMAGKLSKSDKEKTEKGGAQNKVSTNKTAFAVQFVKQFADKPVYLTKVCARFMIEQATLEGKDTFFRGVSEASKMVSEYARVGGYDDYTKGLFLSLEEAAEKIGDLPKKSQGDNPDLEKSSEEQIEKIKIGVNAALKSILKTPMPDQMLIAAGMMKGAAEEAKVDPRDMVTNILWLRTSGPDFGKHIQQSSGNKQAMACINNILQLIFSGKTGGKKEGYGRFGTFLKEKGEQVQQWIDQQAEAGVKLMIETLDKPNDIKGETTQGSSSGGRNRFLTLFDVGEENSNMDEKGNDKFGGDDKGKQEKEDK